MTSPTAELHSLSGSGGATVVQAVTVIMGIVVGLTFMLVRQRPQSSRAGSACESRSSRSPSLSISRRLGSYAALGPGGIDPSAPAASPIIADPLVAGECGNAAFDAVGGHS